MSAGASPRNCTSTPPSWISTCRSAPSGLDFNDEAGQGVADALSAPERLDDVLLDRLLIKRGDHLSLFTAPAALERDYDAAPEAYEAVIDAVRQSTPCVIVDLPHAWTPWIKACLLAADEIVIVATPDLASLRNAKNIIELVKHARPNDTPPRLVINQVGMPKRPEIPAKDFAETMGVDPVAVLPFDPRLVRPGRQQRPDADRTCSPRRRSSEAMRRLAARLTGRTPAGAARQERRLRSSRSSKAKQAGLSHVRQAHRQLSPRSGKPAPRARAPRRMRRRASRRRLQRRRRRARAAGRASSRPQPSQAGRRGAGRTTARKTITRSSPPSLTP